MKATRPTEKVTIRLFAGDRDRLNVLFPGVGYNKVIRHMLSNFIKKVEERANQTQAEPNLATTVSVEEVIEDANHE